MSESVIADDLHIKGEVMTTGDVELQGSIDGEITCRTLMVAQDAKVSGSATAEKVVVRGTVEGKVTGIRVTLTSSAKVHGELICKALSVDEDAFFDGTSQRVADPLSAAKQDQKSGASNGNGSATKSGNGKSGKDSDKVSPPLAAAANH